MVAWWEGARGVMRWDWMAIARMGWRRETTHLIFLTPEPLEIAPPYLVHRVYASSVSRLCINRVGVAKRIGGSYLCPPDSRRFRNTAFVSSCPTNHLPLTIGAPPVPPNLPPPPPPKTTRCTPLTCLAATGSFLTPQPCLNEFASSKIASTSSPFAAPPFAEPARRAASSMEAAFEAAAVRYCIACAGSAVQPQPCLLN